MDIEFTENKYTLYYDESNNIRKLLLDGDEYNIDNDPNQESSPIFVLAGIALNSESENIDFEDLKRKLYLQKGCAELKLAQMVKIRAKFTPIEAFKYALGSKKFNTLFQYLLSKKIFIHYKMINTVYWSFLDIIEDLILCSKEHQDYANQYIYKDCLYRLIKIDKENFLSLMSRFNYPKIHKKDALNFLIYLHDLVESNIESIVRSDSPNDLDFKMLTFLKSFLFKCIHVYGKRVDFELVFNSQKNILIEDFYFFYMNRIKMFPNSLHIFDNEYEIEGELNRIKEYDAHFNKMSFSFVESKEAGNYLVQISDVISGFFRLYFDFLEYASIEQVEDFVRELNTLQSETLTLFKKLLDQSINESHILLYRVIVPIDEHKGSILFSEI
ncbi:hypothetical protein AO721_10920 [Aeromonas veronii]|uniref:DUF3800 domain-containing protein n=1 Tax=Aeromonas veronii TaxID=654 RepID=UPI0007183536|nr:DUF3800 domain-containing protein [Aeromonas veronii]KRV69405.1 hypothetical protein AO728_12150 [Aeromonas veronii]KRV73348.1 hypothetical protein AO719_08095 [Aeromonas veronii]KRV83445.1 hypothetical protein AO721_10920 [Aeromonas veronii]KRV83591.1 hypothetical protein AO739_09760 [Aeromonas veronii]